MNSTKLLKRVTLVLLLLSLIGLIGCSLNKVVLHPIDKQDIYRIEKGTLVGSYTTDRNGYFLSDMYIEEVARARVKQ